MEGIRVFTNKDGDIIEEVMNGNVVSQRNHSRESTISDNGLSNVDALGSMAIAMSGDTNGAVEFLENQANQRQRESGSFPIECNLSNTELESLGFEIKDNQDRWLRTVILPDGWKIVNKAFLKL